MNHPLEENNPMSTEQIKQKRASIREIMVMNNKKITNASQGKKIVSCKDLRETFLGINIESRSHWNYAIEI